MIRLLFGRSFKDMNSGLKLYKAEVARELHLYGGMHRFIPLIATEMGYRVAECPVRHNERRYGASKYSPMKILTEMPDLLTVFFLIEYTTRPLHFFGRIGSALIALGTLCLTYLAILWTQSIPIGTRPLLTLRRVARRHGRPDRLHWPAGGPDRQCQSKQTAGIPSQVRVGHHRGPSTRLRARAYRPDTSARLSPSPPLAFAESERWTWRPDWSPPSRSGGSLSSGRGSVCCWRRRRGSHPGRRRDALTRPFRAALR